MLSSRSPKISTPEAARRNISRVAQLESNFTESRSRIDRLIARIASSTGSLRFLVAHLICFSTWILLNTGTRLQHKFDPYPFSLLGLALACEAVLLSTVVLIEQNWMNRRDDRREHLHLQINLLAEQEITKVLYLQRLICKRLDISEVDRDPELLELSRETAVEQLAEDLGNALDGG